VGAPPGFLCVQDGCTYKYRNIGGFVKSRALLAPGLLNACRRQGRKVHHPVSFSDLRPDDPRGPKGLRVLRTGPQVTLLRWLMGHLARSGERAACTAAAWGQALNYGVRSTSIRRVTKDREQRSTARDEGNYRA